MINRFLFCSFQCDIIRKSIWIQLHHAHAHTGRAEERRWANSFQMLSIASTNILNCVTKLRNELRMNGTNNILACVKGKKIKCANTLNDSRAGRGREKSNLNGKFKFQPRFNGTNKITGISRATCSLGKHDTKSVYKMTSRTKNVGRGRNVVGTVWSGGDRGDEWVGGGKEHTYTLSTHTNTHTHTYINSKQYLAF